MASYLGKIETLKDEFNSLMPFFDSIIAQEQQRDKFFNILVLIGLRSDFSPVRDRILTDSVFPSLEDVSARLLRISLNAIDINEIETSMLAVQTSNQ